MDLWLKILLLVFLFTIFFPYHIPPVEPAQRFINEVHPYSGLSPDLFREFVSNVKDFDRFVQVDPARASNSLDRALEALRELSLYTQRADQVELFEDLNHIADRLAYMGEELLQRTSARVGVRFFPKYLNDIIPPSLDDPADTFRPGHKATSSVCTSGSCRG